MTRAGRWRRGLWHLRTGGVAGFRRWRTRQRPTGSAPRGVVGRPLPGGLTFPELPVPDAPLRRHGLRVAVVLDDFSRLALAYEWQQVVVGPENWRAVLEADPVDLLFVESAWHGNGDAWEYHLAGPSAPRAALVELVAWCRSRGIPTVFWNKEDPTHYGDFLATARLFDHVFTTDADRLPDYRRDLGHDRVGVLPFAAQPALHNPVRHGGGHAERDIAFAGTYFHHRHADRRRQLDLLLGAALRAGAGGRLATGLEIFSRQLGGDERYQFPDPYASRVVGSLSYAEMLTAYRAYKVFLNVNTVVGSPTMCARRVFEVVASGTPVLSTPSPAIDALLGPGAVAQVTQPDEAEQTLRALVANRELRDRQVHRAQRRIWAGHTYAHRVDEVLRVAGLADHRCTGRRPQVSALVVSNRPPQLPHVLETLAAQTEVDVQVCFVAHGWSPGGAALRAAARDRGLGAVEVLELDAAVPLGDCLNRAVGMADGQVLAKIDDDDWYGGAYLSDQAHALDFSGAGVVGKQAHYAYLSGMDATILRFPEHEHRFTDFVTGPTLVMRKDVATELAFPGVSRGEDTAFLGRARAAGVPVYSADRFGFMQMRQADPTRHTWSASDAELMASARFCAPGLARRMADSW